MRAPILMAFVTLMVLAACSPNELRDDQPPRLLDAQVSAERSQLELSFDEPLSRAKGWGDFVTGEAAAEVEGSTVTINLPPSLKPGLPYLWKAQVEDGRSNLTSVSGRFFGPNASPAQLRLNEVRVAGSGEHTDLVELVVIQAGNLGSWCLEAWSSPSTHQRVVLPGVEVREGQMVVVHFRAGGENAVDETQSPGSAVGADCQPGAWDYWCKDPKGLSASKGVIVLRPRPEESPIDGLAYSLKSGESSVIAAAAGWKGADELNPEGCTATRTWCRSQGPELKWVLVANGKATPGLENKLIPWAGPTSNRGSAAKTKG